MELPTVSVVIISRKRQKLLNNLLEALCHQSYLPQEVVVVENDSSESYESIIEKFKNKLNIKHIIESRIGVSSARNTGVNNATQDILAFIDDDCEPTNNWLENLVKPFTEDPHIGVVGGKINSKCRTNSMAEQFCHLIDHLNYFGGIE